MPLTATQKSNLVSTGRQLATQIIELMNTVRAFEDRYNAGDYGTALTDPADFASANAGIAKVDFVAAVATFGTLLTTYDLGHDTNLEKISV